VLAAVLALGWNLNGHRLLDPDEGRNAEVAREMAVDSDYLLPHLDGLPYLDKPIRGAAPRSARDPRHDRGRGLVRAATLGTGRRLARRARPSHDADGTGLRPRGDL
jgi:hypothetical protein